MGRFFKRTIGIGLAAGFLAASLGLAVAGDYDGIKEAQDFATGVPANPSESWILSAGGRMYDNWWNALDVAEPEGTHPAYPEASKKSGSTTWRCKECHGWDFMGTAGVYSSGSHFTGIVGVNGAMGMDAGDFAALMRGDVHGYTADMINDDAMARLAAFISRGQPDMAKYVDLSTRTVIPGDIDRGRSVFQSVCAACHGFDGRFLDWGDPEEPAYIGTEAVAAPDEVFNKIQNAHPGVDMANLRSFGPEIVRDVLTYVATLPTE